MYHKESFGHMELKWSVWKKERKLLGKTTLKKKKGRLKKVTEYINIKTHWDKIL